MRWLLVFLIACVVFNLLQPPLLRKLGMGRMPGDWRFRIGGREVTVPLGSSLVFSLVALLVARWL